PLPNPNGSAPGWFVYRPDGGIAIALPGPPREMRPMWSDEAMPRLKDRGLGDDVAVRTFRLTGIGESAVAEILGEEMLRRGDPEVATYARLEAVDVRVSAVGTRLSERGWRLAVEEIGTAGQVAALFGEAPWLALSRVRPGPTTQATTDDDGLPARAA